MAGKRRQADSLRPEPSAGPMRSRMPRAAHSETVVMVAVATATPIRPIGSCISRKP